MGSVPPSRVIFPAGAIVVVFAAIVFSVLAGVQSYSGALATSQQVSDPWKVDLAFQRLQGIKAKLPKTGVVGYVSDNPIDTDWGRANFFSAQYVLAPLLLVEPQTSRDFEYAVGNFTKQLDYNSFGLTQGLVVVEDLGFGVVLYRKGGR